MTFIVLTGAHGVGKSTLAERFVARLAATRKALLVPETARELVRLGFSVNDEMTEDGFIAYIQTFLKTVREIEADIIVADRSLFDLYLYNCNSTGRIRPLLLEMLYELVVTETKTVDIYAYIPIEFKLESDGVRPPDEVYQRAIDEKALSLLRHFGAKTVFVRGTIDERVSALVKALGDV